MLKHCIKKLVVGLFALVVLLPLFASLAHAIEIKPYSGLVNDFANVLSEEMEQQLEAKLLQEAERLDGVELAVLTLDSLEGETVEQVALAYFDNWQVGKKGEDNGVLLLLAIDDREVRIQTGYGVEGALPDGLAGRIIRQDIVPHLQAGNYDLAIENGVNRILQRIADPASEMVPESTPSSGSIWFVLMVLVIFFGGIVLLIFLITKYAQPSSSSSPSSTRSRPSTSSTRASSSSSSKSFSFGGGRTGGGGASGKW